MFYLVLNSSYIVVSKTMENVKVVDSTHYVFIPVALCRIGRSTMMEFLHEFSNS